MKEETPHSFEMRGRCDGRFEDSGVTCRKPTTGRDQRQKRSPKERSAVPGTVTFSFESCSQPSGGRHPTRWAKRDGSAPANKIVGGVGTNPTFRWGWSSYAFCSGSLQPTISREKRRTQMLEIGDIGG